MKVCKSTPVFHHAERVIHCSVEGAEDSIEVFTNNAWHVIWVDKAEIIHRNYSARREGFRWHPPQDKGKM